MTLVPHSSFRSTAMMVAAAGVLALGACSRQQPANDVVGNDAAVTDDALGNGTTNETAGNMIVDAGAAIPIRSATGQSLGSVTMSDGAGGLMLSVSGSGMPAGTHGIHLHTKGACDGPKFESAGDHWNPGAKKHGRDNPMGAHLGDLANLEVSGNGTATTSFTVAGATSSGETSVADADGTALVIHAQADDYKTDPSGNSGDRIGCAVLAPPKA